MLTFNQISRLPLLPTYLFLSQAGLTSFPALGILAQAQHYPVTPLNLYIVYYCKGPLFCRPLTPLSGGTPCGPWGYPPWALGGAPSHRGLGVSYTLLPANTLLLSVPYAYCCFLVRIYLLLFASPTGLHTLHMSLNGASSHTVG